MHYPDNISLLRKTIDFFWRILPWTIAFFLAFFSAYLYLKKTASFRFLDEENNIVPGYLMTQGFALYRDIFMNHNPLPLVISQILQSIFASSTLFDLVKLHRVFMILFGLVANLLLLIRFRSKALLFVGIYEYLRFYISGQMFLAEGMIAYMFAYYILLLIETYESKSHKISMLDTIALSVSFVFIVLSREPYVPAACVLYLLTLPKTQNNKIAFISIISSALAILVFMFQFDLGEFYKQVVLLNQSYALLGSKDQGGLQIFSGLRNLYEYIWDASKLDKPLYIILGTINIALFILSFQKVRKIGWKSALLTITVVIIILFLAGVRNFASGVEWFGMYRSIPYIAILISLVAALAPKKTVLLLLIFVTLVSVLHPRSHFLEKRDNANEYYINYSPSYTVGNVVSTLCKKTASCTLHIDGLDIYPYFVSKVNPSYRYAIYYPINDMYLDYKSIRVSSLMLNRPTIYYDSACKVSPSSLPKAIVNNYVWLQETDTKSNIVRRSCIAVRSDIIENIDESQISELKNNLFFLTKSGDN